MRAQMFLPAISGLALVLAACGGAEILEPAEGNTVATDMSGDSSEVESLVSAAMCTNIPPDTRYTCQQQAAWGKCGESWMQGFCSESCGRCVSGNASNSANGSANVCTNTPPDNRYSCQQQAGWGKCNEPWMSGRCNESCGRCAQAGAPNGAPDAGQGGAQGAVCSARADEPIQVSFTNGCVDAVRIIWLDYNCREVSLVDALPGQRVDVQTYVTHSFRVRMSGSNIYLGDVLNLRRTAAFRVCN